MGGGGSTRIAGCDLLLVMRGEVDSQIGLLTLITPEKRVPADHPIRRIKALADEALKRLDPVFDEMYDGMGRPSIPPERPLKAQLLIALYTVRSERQSASG